MGKKIKKFSQFRDRKIDNINSGRITPEDKAPIRNPTYLSPIIIISKGESDLSKVSSKHKEPSTPQYKFSTNFKKQPEKMGWTEIEERKGLENFIEDPENLKSLNVYFDSCRNIPKGPNNVFIGLIIRILEYSITYDCTEIITKMIELIRSYEEHTEEYSTINKLAKSLSKIIFSEETIASKLLSLKNCFTHYDTLIQLIRKCAKSCVQRYYFTEKYKELREATSYERSFENLLSLITSQTATLQLYDYIILLDCLNIQIVIFDDKTLAFENYGTGNHIFSFLGNNFGYNILYTIQESYIVKTSKEDADSLKKFLAKRDLEINIILENEEKKLENEEKNEKFAAEICCNAVNETFYGQNVNDVIHQSVFMNDKSQMENILKEFACSSCLFISKVAKLRCGHNLCEMHVFSNNKIISNCIICNEQTDQSFLQAFIRNK